MNMLYLLDANVPITVNATYYPMKRLPQFWDWLAGKALAGHVKIPLQIFEEIAPANDDPLKGWIEVAKVRAAVVLDEVVDADLLRQVMDKGYAPDLDETDVEKMGRDPFLVAYAMMNGPRTVVTKEVSKPKKQHANRVFPMSATPWVRNVSTTLSSITGLIFELRSNETSARSRKSPVELHHSPVRAVFASTCP